MELEEKIRLQRKKARLNAKYKPKHWVTKVYGRMKLSSKARKNCKLMFTKEEFAEWVYKQQNFYKLHKEWVDSGFKKNLCPSIDRIDDYGGYSFDNIVLTTWEINNLRGRVGIKNKHQCGSMAKEKWSKKVNQLNDDMEIVNTFYSAREAARVLGFDSSTISKCCRGEKKTHKGYKWEYADER